MTEQNDKLVLDTETENLKITTWPEKNESKLPKTLFITNYEKLNKNLPKTGKHILAHYDDDSIVVYQAFKKEIAEFAVKNQYFGGDAYATTRMTWIKTNFCWMQYRSGWSTKKDQERTLAIWLKRSAFEDILKNAILSHFVENLHESKEEWSKSLKKEEGVIRLQWDPDHSPVGGKLQRRAIQLGIKGQYLKGFIKPDCDIVQIMDVTDFCHEQFEKNVKDKKTWNDLEIPYEREYIVEDVVLAKNLTLIEDSSEKTKKKKELLDNYKESSDDEVLKVPKEKKRKSSDKSKEAKKQKKETTENDTMQLQENEESTETERYEHTPHVPYKESELFDSEKRFDLYCKKQLFGGNFSTVSIAIPGSIFESYSSQREVTQAIGSIARFLAIFEVDEVIIYSDSGDFVAQPDSNEVTVDFNMFAGKIFEYMETPPYLRKFLFPTHPDLQFVEILPPLGIQSHLKESEATKFREGIVLKNDLVNVGFKQVCNVDKQLEKNTRCTIHILAYKTEKVHGLVVDPLYPKEKENTYWGYQTRVAKSFSEIWSECLYSGGYDYTIGVTNEDLDEEATSEVKLPSFRRLLIVFGNETLKKGIKSSSLETKDPKKIFNKMINPMNGVRMNVKTQESIPIVLTTLSSQIKKNVVPRSQNQIKMKQIIPK